MLTLNFNLFFKKSNEYFLITTRKNMEGILNKSISSDEEILEADSANFQPFLTKLHKKKKNLKSKSKEANGTRSKFGFKMPSL